MLTFAVGYLLDNDMKYIACYVMTGSVVFGTIFQFFVKQRLRRTRAGLKSGSFSFHLGNTTYNAQSNQPVADNYQYKPTNRPSERSDATLKGDALLG